MDLEHMKRAATSPEQWRRLVRRHAVTTDELAKPRIALPSAHKSDHWPVGTFKQKLVPGGRYLVTSRFDRALRTASISLWDLGVPGAPVRFTPRRVDCRVFATGVSSNGGISIDACFDDDTLRVLAVAGSPLTSAVVMAISPLKDSQFKELGGIQIEAQGQRVGCFIQSHKALLRIGGEVMAVWDYTRGRLSKWKASELPGHLEHTAIILTDDFVLCICSRGTFAWPLENSHARSMGVPSRGVSISLWDSPVVRSSHASRFGEQELDKGAARYYQCDALQSVQGWNSFLMEVMVTGPSGQITQLDFHRFSVGALGISSQHLSSRIGFPSDFYPSGRHHSICLDCGSECGHWALRSDVYNIIDIFTPIHNLQQGGSTKGPIGTPVSLALLEGMAQPLAVCTISGRFIYHDKKESVVRGEAAIYCVDYLE